MVDHAQDHLPVVEEGTALPSIETIDGAWVLGRFHDRGLGDYQDGEKLSAYIAAWAHCAHVGLHNEANLALGEVWRWANSPFAPYEGSNSAAERDKRHHLVEDIERELIVLFPFTAVA